MNTITNKEIWERIKKIQNLLSYSDTEMADKLSLTSRELETSREIQSEIGISNLEYFLKEIHLGQKLFFKNSYDPKRLIEQNLTMHDNTLPSHFFENPTIKVSSLFPFINFFFASGNPQLYTVFCRENQISPKSLTDLKLEANINLPTALSQFIEDNLGGENALSQLAHYSTLSYKHLFPSDETRDYKEFCDCLFNNFIPDNLEKTNRYSISMMSSEGCIVKFSPQVELTDVEFKQIYGFSSVQKVRLKRLEYAFTMANYPCAEVQIMSINVKKRECTYLVSFKLH